MPEIRTYETFSTGAGVFKLKPRPHRRVEGAGDGLSQADGLLVPSRTSQAAQKSYLVSRETILRIIAMLKEI